MSDTQRRRQFLNPVEGIAAVEWHVTLTEGKRSDSVNASFTISDCNRVVDLDFGAYRARDIEDTRTKITRLRRNVQAFERALLDALTEVEGRVADD